MKGSMISEATISVNVNAIADTLTKALDDIRAQVAERFPEWESMTIRDYDFELEEVDVTTHGGTVLKRTGKFEVTANLWVELTRPLTREEKRHS